MSYAVIEALKDELKGFLSSKATIRFPLDKPLPATLVKKKCESAHRGERREEEETALIWTAITKVMV